MQVRELITALELMPKDAEVYLESLREIHNIRSIYCDVRRAQNRVYLRDHFVHREPKTMRAYDGNEYEIPWP